MALTHFNIEDVAHWTFAGVRQHRNGLLDVQDRLLFDRPAPANTANRERIELSRTDTALVYVDGRAQGYDLPHLDWALKRSRPARMPVAIPVAAAAVIAFLPLAYGCQLGSEAGKGACRKRWADLTDMPTQLVRHLDKLAQNSVPHP